MYETLKFNLQTVILNDAKLAAANVSDDMSPVSCELYTETVIKGYCPSLKLSQLSASSARTSFR